MKESFVTCQSTLQIVSLRAGHAGSLAQPQKLHKVQTVQHSMEMNKWFVVHCPNKNTTPLLSFFHNRYCTITAESLT